VSDSSASNNPGNGDPLNGDSVGQMNAGYDWNIVSDTAQEWTADIKNTFSSPIHADISARRLQGFRCAAGNKLVYALWDTTTGSALAYGSVAAERSRFFVIPQLPFDGNWHRLTVWRSSGQAIGEVLALNAGDSVDLDSVVVTGVFSDVCYAQAGDRVPSIAILGASGLAEGSVIRLRGTKTTFGHMCAVNASPVAPTSYGKTTLKPFGLAQPRLSVSNPIELGALVKVWGVASDTVTGFAVDNGGPNPISVFGNVGTVPQSGHFVSVVGICAEMPGGGYGIRVRKTSDVVGL